ncbi:MAG: hypothetical protein E7286_02560 [Lachnospiraceae bacterium]|nr:hypothetical protein [Lachnospiraceae bacterium]
MRINAKTYGTGLIALGGAGLSFSKYIKEMEYTIDTLAIDSNPSELNASAIEKTLQIPLKADNGRQKFNYRTKRQLHKFLKKNKQICVVSGLGGETSFHLLPDLMEIICENVYIQLHVVYFFPFDFESDIRRERAKETVQISEIFADSVRVIKNQDLMEKDESFTKIVRKGHEIALSELKRLMER